MAHGGRLVVELAVVGAPGLARSKAASLVASCSGLKVGGEASGEASTGEVNTGEVNVDEEELPVVSSTIMHGVGDGVTDIVVGELGVGVCATTGGVVTAGAQAAANNKPTPTANNTVSFKRMMSLPGPLHE